MTSIILARGSKWSSAELYDGWGDVTDDQATQMGNLTVERFHELAEKNGSSAYWTPSTSEVIGHIDDNATSEDLNGWREEALDNVWSAVVDGDGPMADRVKEIL